MTNIQKFSGSIIGDGVTTSFVLTHNLNTKEIVAAFRDSSNNGVVTDWQADTANTILISFGTAPANGTVYSVVVVG